MKTTMIMTGLLLSLSACSGTANLVRKDALGGRVQLNGPYMPAMADARTLMVEHCNGRFDYREQGEAVEFRCRHWEEATTFALLSTRTGM